MSTKSKPYIAPLAYAGLALLFIAQYVFFRDFILTEISPYYPFYHDQTAYLRDAYLLFEDIKEHGHIKLFKGLVLPSAPQGKLLPVEANLVFLLMAGASRFGALLTNLLYFFALQASLFYLIKKASGRYASAFIVLGVTLLLEYPFFWAGSLFDFRIDFQAFCLYGIFVSTIIASNAFFSNRWAVIATILGFLLALLRHVALGYIGGVYLAMLVFLLPCYFISGDWNKKRETARRIRNVILSGIAILGSVFPFLWASRVKIYEYYGVGHFLGKEKEIRSPGETIGTNVVFYLERFYEHVGRDAAYALGALLAVGIMLSAYALFKKRLDIKETSANRGFSLESFVFLVIAATAPFFILITDLNKSPVVGAVIMAPVILFCALAFSRGISPLSSRTTTILLCITATAIMALGLKNQYVHYSASMPPDRRAELEGITRMVIDTGDYCEKNSITAPLISFDAVRDYFTEGSFTIINYEARQRFLLFGMQLPVGIFDISKEDAVARLRRSAVVLFSPDAIIDANYPFDVYYPFDASMDAMRPELLSFIEKEFVRLNDYRIAGRILTVYVKPGKG